VCDMALLPPCFLILFHIIEFISVSEYFSDLIYLVCLEEVIFSN